MGVVTDILAIWDRLLQVLSKKDATAREAQQLGKAETAIYTVFNDPKYPKRQRSFGAIRKKLYFLNDSSGAFDKAKALEILSDMGAQHVRGEDDDALFHLPQPEKLEARDDGSGGTKEPKQPFLRLWFLLIVLLVLLALWLSPVFSWVPGLFPSGTTSFQDCISSGEDTPERWALCYSKHPE